MQKTKQAKFPISRLRGKDQGQKQMKQKIKEQCKESVKQNFVNLTYDFKEPRLTKSHPGK